MQHLDLGNRGGFDPVQVSQERKASRRRSASVRRRRRPRNWRRKKRFSSIRYATASRSQPRFVRNAHAGMAVVEMQPAAGAHAPGRAEQVPATPGEGLLAVRGHSGISRWRFQLTLTVCSSHALQVRFRLASARDCRALHRVSSNCWGIPSPVPKYFSSGVCPANAECGSRELCSFT